MPPKPVPTHFLCIPLVTQSSRPQLTQSLAAFRADVSDPLSFNLPEDATRPVGSLHLTLGVFSFPKNSDEGAERLEKAKSILQSLKPSEILKGIKTPAMPGTTPAAPAATKKGKEEDNPLLITLRGLQTMQSTTPSKASVIYAPPADSLGKLQQFCERVRGVFQEVEGLMIPDDRPLLLHATVVNTIYVKGKERQQQQHRKKGHHHGGGGSKRGERVTVDATGILDRYEDQVWMEDVRVEKIAICKMGAKKIEVDGVVVDEEYEVVGEVDI